SPRSPLFAPDRLLSLGKRPERVLHSLRFVDQSLHQLENYAASSLRRRTHEHPFIWRMYGFSERLYFMPYFADKDATKVSPVLVFSKRNSSLYQTFVDWFDFAWEKAAPQRVGLPELITPATPCGTALFLKWNDYHVFGISQRAIREAKRGPIRFYGLGGKRSDPLESFEQCALREGNEESGGAIGELLDSQSTAYFRSDGTIHDIT